MKTEKGFTIIELMIAAAVIGILAAIAVPVYRDYIDRSKVAEMAQLLGALKNPAIEFYMNKGYWPPAPVSTGGKATGQYVSYIVTGGSEPDFYVEGTMKGQIAGETIYGRKMRMTYNTQTRDWDCLVTVIPNNEGIPIKYVPTPCKN